MFNFIHCLANIFKPKSRNRTIADAFPKLSIGDCCINFVTTLSILVI